MSNQYSLEDITIVTPHFNPSGFRRTWETYYEWMPKLPKFIADKVVCYEAVFDDDKPEIKGSIVIPGTREKNLMFQKEALLQIALERCETPLFCWLDHDIYFEEKNSDWLQKGVALLSDNIKAVQLFGRVYHYDQDGTLEVTRNKFNGGWSPGGLWVAKTQFLKDVGGFPYYKILGSGDDELFKTIKDSSTFINLPGFHIWHGDRKNRSYIPRNLILDRHYFDKVKDIERDENGLVSWASDKPIMHQEVRDYFDSRLEDGVPKKRKR